MDKKKRHLSYDSLQFLKYLSSKRRIDFLLEKVPGSKFSVPVWESGNLER
jgi:hypothetical protein